MNPGIGTASERTWNELSNRDSNALRRLATLQFEN
jgi:hypothetical protein